MFDIQIWNEWMWNIWFGCPIGIQQVQNVGNFHYFWRGCLACSAWTWLKSTYRGVQYETISPNSNFLMIQLDFYFLDPYLFAWCLYIIFKDFFFFRNICKKILLCSLSMTLLCKNLIRSQGTKSELREMGPATSPVIDSCCL